MSKHELISAYKVLAIGFIIAVLSYLFHPEIGKFSFLVNGHPITEPYIKFGAFATFFLIMMLSAVFILLVFLEISLFLFAGSLLIAFIILSILTPYLWPLLLAVFIIIAALSISHQ